MSHDPRHNPFARSKEERDQARLLMMRYSDGSGFEVSVCAVCGMWGKWDSDLIDCGGLVCVDGEPHTVARVRLQVSED